MLDAKGIVEPYREPGQGRGWLTLLLGLIVFAAFGGVVGYAYLNGLPGIGGEPPLIQAATGPYRRAPSDRGGLEVANSHSTIIGVIGPRNEPPRVERVLPPDPALALETPEPEADAAAAPDPVPADPAPDAAAPAETGSTEPAVSAPPTTTADADPTLEPPAAEATLMPPPKPEPPVQLAAREPPATISALPRPAPAPTPAPPAPAPAPDAAQPAPVIQPAPVAQPARPPAAQPAPAAPGQSAAVQPRAAPALAPIIVTPRVIAPPVAPGAGPKTLVRPEPATPDPAQPSSAGAGVYRLQLTAVRSESGLTKAWADLRDRYPAALASVSPEVERTQTSSGPLFRLQAGPFSNREAAANACGAIRSTGGQCFIVGPIAP